MRAFFTLLLTLQIFAGTAGKATPPRIILAEETLLANNGTHVFILRKIEDNVGYHTTLQSDLLLISRNLTTGDDERQWAVLNILQEGTFGEEYAAFTNLDGTERINPFNVLLWRKASNILPAPQHWATEYTETDDQGISIRDRDGMITHRLDWATADAQVDSSLQLSRVTIPPYQAEHGDELFVIPVALGADCILNSVHYFFVVEDDFPVNRVAAQMICTPDDRPLSTYIVIPPVEN